MIPPEFKHRFVGDSGTDLGACAIDVVFPDGERRRVLLRLGVPYVRDGVTKIRSELEGLDRTDGPLQSDDSFFAILYGVRWIVGRLEIFQERHGCQYYWPDSSDIFDFREVFSTAR